MAKQTTVIEIPSPPRTGLRGRIDKLFQEYNTKAQALRITAEILDDDDRRIALETAPRKFLQAVNHRNGAAGRPLVKGKRGPYKTKAKPKREESSSLIILEQLGDDARPLADVVAAAAQAGTVIHGRAIGSLIRFGYAKGNRATGYRRTPKGATYAATMRAALASSAGASA